MTRLAEEPARTVSDMLVKMHFARMLKMADDDWEPYDAEERLFVAALDDAERLVTGRH